MHWERRAVDKGVDIAVGAVGIRVEVVGIRVEVVDIRVEEQLAAGVVG